MRMLCASLGFAAAVGVGYKERFQNSVLSAQMAYTQGSDSKGTKRKIYGWGANGYGQLGIGSEDMSIATPREVPFPHEVKSIHCGDKSSAVVSEQGKVYTQGCGLHGRLGTGSSDIQNQTVPRLVSALSNEIISTMSMGEFHSVAVTNEGNMLSWGRAGFGVLGQAVSSSSASGQRLSSAGMQTAEGIPGQVLKPSGVQFSKVSCGRRHTLALDQNGICYSWGYGKDGVLGHGNRDNIDVPKAIDALRNEVIVDICCGKDFSLALTKDGIVYSFGADDFGQLSQGHVDRFQDTPKVIESLREHKITGIACGELHAAFVSEDGKVFTVGLQKEGQGGHGPEEIDNLSLAKPVSFLKDVKVEKVACGGANTAIITSNKELYIWGRGRNGQIGVARSIESEASNKSIPQLVSSLPAGSKVESVAIGGDFIMAIVEVPVS